jgi:SNF2 family DNA or RNA helicase
MPHMTSSQLPGRFDVATEWSDRDLIKTVPGAKWDSQRKTWHVAMTWAACVQMRGTFGPRLTISDEVKAWANVRKAEVGEARAWREVIDPGVEIEGLFPWQVADYFWASVVKDGLLGNDQGTGKTASMQTILRNMKDALPALIVCPNSVKRVWKNEAAKWIPEANIYIVAGNATQRKKIITDALADPMSMIIINYEGARGHSRLAPYGSVALKKCQACGGTDPKVKSGSCHVHKKELNGTGVIKSIAIDEAQRLKDPKSQQTRAVWALAHDPSITHHFAMTGTPIANHIGDLWAIMHAIARDEYPSRSAFLDRYAQLSWNEWGGLDIVGIRQDNAAEFFSFFDARYRRITKAAAAPWLPEKYRSVRLAELPPKMRKAYDELDTQLVTRLDDGSIVFVPNNLTQTTRLLQLSSAYGTVDAATNRYTMTDPSPKIDVLEEIVEEAEGRPICVTAMSKQLINLAADRLAKKGVTIGLITGDIHERDREKVLERFQAGQIKVLLFTLGAGGEGLTMTAADTIVFLQRDWSVIKNLQAEDRVHRIGSQIHKAIHIIDVVAPDTVEEWQIQKVLEKLRRLEEIRRDGQEITASFVDDVRTDDNFIMKTLIAPSDEVPYP